MFKIERNDRWFAIRSGRKYDHKYNFLTRKAAKNYASVLNNLVMSSNAIGYGSK